MKHGRIKVSAEAEASYLADVALAARFSELLSAAQSAEQEYRHAQGAGAPSTLQYPLAHQLDVALTDVTRAAYAAQRAEIGPRGYEDRIYLRKSKAKPAVRAPERHGNTSRGRPWRAQVCWSGVEASP